MANCFLCIVSEEMGGTVKKMESFESFLNKSNEIIHWFRWYSQIPNCYLLKTNIETSSKLTDVIRRYTRDAGTFFIVRLTGADKNGWLNKEIWDYMNK